MSQVRVSACRYPRAGQPPKVAGGCTGKQAGSPALLNSLLTETVLKNWLHQSQLCSHTREVNLVLPITLPKGFDLQRQAVDHQGTVRSIGDLGECILHKADSFRKPRCIGVFYCSGRISNPVTVATESRNRLLKKIATWNRHEQVSQLRRYSALPKASPLVQHTRATSHCL